MTSDKIKYTSDGKKVVVIGSLNSQEKIVQEVFVVDGSEIPSGEHFVVKSLHDSRAISWKEQAILDIEKEYNTTYNKQKEELKKIVQDHRFKVDTIKAKIGFLSQLNSSFSTESLQQLIDFIVGDVEYVLLDNYGTLSIDKYDEQIAEKEYGRFESLRLCSVFGRTDGNLSYKINRYGDGSGNWTTVHPFKTFEEARIKLDVLFEEKLKGGLTDSLLKVAEKYSIPIPNDKMTDYKQKMKQQLENNINSYRKSIEGWEKTISEL